MMGMTAQRWNSREGCSVKGYFLLFCYRSLRKTIKEMGQQDNARAFARGAGRKHLCWIILSYRKHGPKFLELVQPRCASRHRVQAHPAQFTTHLGERSWVS